ncbi:MAG: T9SS type A sorting domain-containing protein [Microscillaceae bacterium]|nr:T9SS type A sorting domain-containing protein [Microscillaceae bacterium]
MLQEAGFLVGRSNTQVSDAVRNFPPNRDNDFTTSVPFRQHISPSQDYSYTNTVFTDIPNNPNRLNVQITQRSYAWNTPQRKNFVIIEYRIKNIGTSSLVNLFAGLYADWNVIFTNNNRARWNNQLKLGYVHDVNNLYYTGIALLTDNFQNYTAYNNAANPLADGFSTAEKFLALSDTPKDTTAGLTFSGQDVSHLISAKIPLLEVGQEDYVAFAFVVGETFAEIYQATLQAKQTYQQIQTSPTPILNDVAVCSGSTYTIVPQGGSRFTFYVQPPPSIPIFTGNSLLINNIRSPRTYYVTCVDSLFESPATAITISPIEHVTRFTVSPNDSIDLRVAGAVPLTFQSTTQGAVQWQWNFGNGQTANVANPPPVLYENEGIYAVKLVTRNAQNCADSLTQNIVIYRSPITQLVEKWQKNIRFAPNPFEDWIQLHTGQNLGQATLEIEDLLGRKLYRTQLSLDQIHTLQLADLPKGILLFKVQTPQGILLQKIVKQ